MSAPEPWPAHSRVWRDKEGYPWVEAGEPGSGRVFCYDGYLRRRMGTALQVRDLEDAAAEFGLVPLSLEEGPWEYMLQVRRLGRWRDWWKEPATPEWVEQAGGLNGLAASLRTAPRPYKGQVRLVAYYQETSWVQGDVVGFVDKVKSGRGRHAGWLHGRVRASEDTRACARLDCGHERRVHDHYSHGTHCSRCPCGRWTQRHSGNTGFIAILAEVDRSPGGDVKKRVIMRAWAVEAWLNLRYQPWRLLPCIHKPVRRTQGREYSCERCGSGSPRVQRKGEDRARSLRRRNA